MRHKGLDRPRLPGGLGGSWLLQAGMQCAAECLHTLNWKMSCHTQIIWLTAWKLADSGSLDGWNTLHFVLRIKISIVGYTIDFPFPCSARVLQICIYVECQCATLNIKLIVMPGSRGEEGGCHLMLVETEHESHWTRLQAAAPVFMTYWLRLLISSLVVPPHCCRLLQDPGMLSPLTKQSESPLRHCSGQGSPGGSRGVQTTRPSWPGHVGVRGVSSMS